MARNQNIYKQTNKRVIKIMVFFSIIVALVVTNVLFTMISGKHLRSGQSALAFNANDNVVTIKILLLIVVRFMTVIKR